MASTITQTMAAVAALDAAMAIATAPFIVALSSVEGFALPYEIGPPQVST